MVGLILGRFCVWIFNHWSGLWWWRLVVLDCGGVGGVWVVLVVVGDWVFIFFFTLKRLGKGRERLMRVCGGRGLMRVEVREKINKIVIYTSTVTVQICTVTVANMCIYTTIVGLMWSRFRKYFVNFAFFFLFCTILHPLMWVLLDLSFDTIFHLNKNWKKLEGF